jgi:hypothetical protein
LVSLNISCRTPVACIEHLDRVSGFTKELFEKMISLFSPFEVLVETLFSSNPHRVSSVSDAEQHSEALFQESIAPSLGRSRSAESADLGDPIALLEDD